MMDNNYFRDQYKNPDLYPADPLDKREIKEELIKDEQIKKEKADKAALETPDVVSKNSSEKMHTSLADNYRLVIQIVKDMSLKPEFKNDAEEIARLESRKGMIINTLHNVTKDIENYIAQINYTILQNKDGYDDIEKYQANASFSDVARKGLHDKLISDLKMAIKWINVSFNEDFPNDLRLQEEMKLTDRRGQSEAEVSAALRERNYFKFPMGLGVIINKEKMPRGPQGEREYIMHWAFSFYDDLTKLNNLLDKKQDSN